MSIDLPLIHCDELVLHAPNSCSYCDLYPEWQALRIRWNINFTGENDPNKTTCPAERRRNLGVIERWGGNVPQPPDVPR